MQTRPEYTTLLGSAFLAKKEQFCKSFPYKTSIKQASIIKNVLQTLM